MILEPKKIEFHFEDDIKHCVHDVISSWLRELDIEPDEKIKKFLKIKILELDQVRNRTGKPNIHFHDGNNKYDKVKFK